MIAPHKPYLRYVWMAILGAVLLMPGPIGALTEGQQPSFILFFILLLTQNKFKKIDLDFVLVQARTSTLLVAAASTHRHLKLSIWS